MGTCKTSVMLVGGGGVLGRVCVCLCAETACASLVMGVEHTAETSKMLSE